MLICYEALHYILLGVLNLNWLRGLDPITAGYKPAKQAHMENRVNTCKPNLEV